MVEKRTKQQIGKQSKEKGRRFEEKVRLDLEKVGWIVDRFTKNVEFNYGKSLLHSEEEKTGKSFKFKEKGKTLIAEEYGKLVPAKPKIRMVKTNQGFLPILMNTYTGFPDYLCFKCWNLGDEGYIIADSFNYKIAKESLAYQIIGIECKLNGKIDKEEKEKINWLLSNRIFSKILVASKSKERGKIKYKEII